MILRTNGQAVGSPLAAYLRGRGSPPPLFPWTVTVTVTVTVDERSVGNVHGNGNGNGNVESGPLCGGVLSPSPFHEL
jgi:hypothetical protein